MPEAGVVAVVSRAAVQRQAVVSHRGRQLANRRPSVIEIPLIDRIAGTTYVKIVSNTGMMPAKIARTTLMTSGMTTIIMVA